MRTEYDRNLLENHCTIFLEGPNWKEKCNENRKGGLEYEKMSAVHAREKCSQLSHEYVIYRTTRYSSRELKSLSFVRCYGNSHKNNTLQPSEHILKIFISQYCKRQTIKIREKQY